MIHLNKNLKIVDKSKTIIGIVLSLFFALNVFMLALTSGYKFDGTISKTMSKGMNNDFVRGGGAFTIMDGFNSVVTYCVPGAMLIFESVYIYLSKKEKNYVIKDIAKGSLLFIYLVVIGFYEAAMVLLIPHFTMGDAGFGKNFIYGFGIDNLFIIPIRAVSFFINNAICLLLLGYVHFVLAKKSYFLKERYGIKAIKAFVYVALVYIPYEVISKGMSRPHPYRIEGKDFLNGMKSVDNGRYYSYYDNYINGQTTVGGSYNGGGIDNSGKKDISFPTNTIWPGYKPGAKSTFVKGLPYRNNFTEDFDFPSGHVSEMCIAMYMVMIIFSSPEKNRKTYVIKMASFTVIFAGFIDMELAMLVMMGHGESDMAFSFVGAFPAYFLSNGIVDIFVKCIPDTKSYKRIFK